MTPDIGAQQYTWLLENGHPVFETGRIQRSAPPAGPAEHQLTIRVFIADDHGIVRAGLRGFIDAEPDMQVVGEASDGPGAEAGIKLTEPDVALMDISMPGGGGIAAIAAIKQVRPRTRFVVLTAHDQVAYIRATVSAGAEGFVAKTALATELLGAIRAVAQGRTFIDASSGLDHSLRSNDLPFNDVFSTSLTKKQLLTAREREVLGRVAEGYTNAQIAGELRLGIKSIETYRSRAMSKLGLVSRSDLVRFALESGLLSAGKHSP